MKKKICSLLLALIMVATMLPSVTWADETTSGSCGENLTWTLDDSGTLTISGAGEMENYWEENPALWNAYKSEITSAVILKGATSVGEYALFGCAALTSITIPDSVTRIGSYALNCPALTDVYFAGSQSQWNAIEIADEGNDPLRNATIHFAQPDPQPPVETGGTITVSSVSARAGQTVTVKLDLSANKGISNMRLQMSYPEGFTLESIRNGAALSTLDFTPPGDLTANPVNFVWDGIAADSSEGCILELTFRAADTVAAGDYSISLSYQKNDVLDGELKEIDLALQDGTVSVSTVTYGSLTGAVTSFGDESDEVTLELIPLGGTEAIYTTKATGATAATASGTKITSTYAFTNVEAGRYTLRVIKKNHVTREYEVEILADGAVQDVMICLLGDVNMDGKVNTKDYTRLLKHVNRTSLLDGYALQCANVNGDTKVNTKDYTRLLKHINRTAPLW